jgi:RHS repeat-associated protein
MADSRHAGGIRKSPFERERAGEGARRRIGPSMLAGSEVARHSSDPLYGIYAYTAREWDPEIGLHYYRARYYDPRVGRFISEDPIEFAGGTNF